MQCTCGAQLPDDARFCLRCGRPQFEEDRARLQDETPVPVAVEIASQPARINFGNKRALSVSIIVALLTLCAVLFISGLNLALASVVLLPLFCFSGFVAARWYARKTGEILTAQNAARLGFMTALWAFLIVAVVYALTAVVISSPEIREQAAAALKSRGTQLPPETLKLFDDPRKFIVLMLGQLLVNFCLFTFPSMLGGLLSVRFGRK